MSYRNVQVAVQWFLLVNLTYLTVLKASLHIKNGILFLYLFKMQMQTQNFLVLKGYLKERTIGRVDKF